MSREVYQLLRDCFPKYPIGYLEKIMENRYGEKAIFTLDHTDFAVGMVFANDYDMVVGGKDILASRLSGICIKDGERQRGFGRKLVAETLKQLADRGNVVATCHMKKSGFLEPLGFMPFACTELMAIDNVIDGSFPLNLENAGEMLEVYEEYAKTFYSYTKRSLKDMENVLGEYKEYGMAIGHKSGNKLVAYALIDGKGNVNEVCFRDKFFVDKLGIDNYRIPAMAGREENSLRVLNIEKFILGAGYQKEFVIDMNIQFTDSLIESNNKILHVKIQDGVAEVSKTDEVDLEYDVNDFANTVLRSGESATFERF